MVSRHNSLHLPGVAVLLFHLLIISVTEIDMAYIFMILINILAACIFWLHRFINCPTLLISIVCWCIMLACTRSRNFFVSLPGGEKKFQRISAYLFFLLQRAAPKRTFLRTKKLLKPLEINGSKVKDLTKWNVKTSWTCPKNSLLLVSWGNCIQLFSIGSVLEKLSSVTHHQISVSQHFLWNISQGQVQHLAFANAATNFYTFPKR